MLLDEIFNNIKHTKKVWVCKKGKLQKIEKDAAVTKDQLKKPATMFPIHKPRQD